MRKKWMVLGMFEVDREGNAKLGDLWTNLGGPMEKFKKHRLAIRPGEPGGVLIEGLVESKPKTFEGANSCKEIEVTGLRIRLARQSTVTITKMKG